MRDFSTVWPCKLPMKLTGNNTTYKKVGSLMTGIKNGSWENFSHMQASLMSSIKELAENFHREGRLAGFISGVMCFLKCFCASCLWPRSFTNISPRSSVTQSQAHLSLRVCDVTSTPDETALCLLASGLFLFGKTPWGHLLDDPNACRVNQRRKKNKRKS